jgi:hypothetical protein
VTTTKEYQCTITRTTAGAEGAAATITTTIVNNNKRRIIRRAVADPFQSCGVSEDQCVSHKSNSCFIIKWLF